MIADQVAKYLWFVLEIVTDRWPLANRIRQTLLAAENLP